MGSYRGWQFEAVPRLLRFMMGADVKYVNYAGASRVITGNAIAAAVIRYAAALSQSRLTDVVSIPTADCDGSSTTVEVMLAPGIAVAVEPALDDLLEPEDEAFIAEIGRRTSAALAFDPHAVGS